MKLSRLSSPVVALWVYVLGACTLLWPSVASLGQVLPGAARSDLWNSLWSMWFVAESLGDGVLPWHTRLLDHPTGGVLLVADLPGALFCAPLTWIVGVEGAYACLITLRLVLAGWSAHLLATELNGRESSGSLSPYIAGVTMLTAPVLISGIHNGTSEAASVAPVAFAGLAALRACRSPGRVWLLGAVTGLIWATLAGGYTAVAAFLFVGCILVTEPTRTGWRRALLRRGGLLGLGLLGSVPIAVVIARAATVRNNLVGIKHAAELASVRRTTGPADPIAFFRGFDYRSPDFRVLSRYGEDFVHSPYVGVVLVAVVVIGIWTRRTPVRPLRGIALAGALTAVLSMGPVVVHEGLAWVFLDERVMPLPYLLLERLPGFGSLSLLWRLAMGPVLALGVFAAWTLRQTKPSWVVLVGLLVVAEFRWIAPTAQLPAMTDARLHPALEVLAESPEGAVLNHPVVGGRAYLHEQTGHRQSLAARLNFPNNGVGRVVWESARKAASLEDAGARKLVRETAQDLGVRYVVVHDDPDAGPDMYDDAVKALLRLFPALPAGPPVAESGPHAADLTVLRLY